MSDELYHHGILGQKWGKKNGPPYPLDAKDHSASEKKAGWRKSLSQKEIIKEKKQKAKNYQKSINTLLNKDASYLLNYWMLEESKEIVDEKLNRLKFDNKDQKRIERWINKSNIMSMKMDDINTKFSTNRKEINDLFTAMTNDKDVVYEKKSSSDYYTYPGRNTAKYDRKLKKELNKKYGRNLYYTKDNAFKSVTNDQFVVKAATDKNKSKYKYNKPDRDKLNKPRFTRIY